MIPDLCPTRPGPAPPPGPKKKHHKKHTEDPPARRRLGGGGTGIRDGLEVAAPEPTEYVAPRRRRGELLGAALLDKGNRAEFAPAEDRARRRGLHRAAARRARGRSCSNKDEAMSSTKWIAAKLGPRLHWGQWQCSRRDSRQRRLGRRARHVRRVRVVGGIRQPGLDVGAAVEWEIKGPASPHRPDDPLSVRLGPAGQERAAVHRGRRGRVRRPPAHPARRSRGATRRRWRRRRRRG